VSDDEAEASDDDDDTDDEDLELPANRKRKGKEPTKPRQAKLQRKFEHISEEGWESAAKINKLCEILDQIRTNDPTEKVIVFSQV
jgi:hypothetical protein